MKYSDEGDCEFEVIKLRLDSESLSELPLPRLTLKRVRTNKLAERKIDQVLKENKMEVEDELVEDDAASQERSTLVVKKKTVKKKRRYVEPPGEMAVKYRARRNKKNKKKPLADDNSETIICTVEEQQILQQSVAIEKAHKPKAMSSKESDGKEKRQYKKKQQHMQKQPKAELPQLTNEPSSSCMMHAPCQDGACAGTSAAGSVSSSKQRSLYEFCLDESKKTFKELDYSKMLRDAEFTEEQREILQQSFEQLARKMSYIKANSNRFLKTHKCNRCGFSITHQCMPLDFIQSVPFGTELMTDTFIAPDQTVVCDCGFGFSHVHVKRTRTPVIRSFVEMNTPYLKLFNRSVDVSCPICYTKIVMNNAADGVCCDLATWDSITGSSGPIIGEYRKRLYAGIESCFRTSGTDAPRLHEFFTCRKDCCLIYHRCSKNDEVPGASGSSPG